MSKRKTKKKKYYALPCMLAILVLAGLLTASGMALRRTLLRGLPQYKDAPDLAIPFMLLQDAGPLRAARERAEWEARQAAPPPEIFFQSREGRGVLPTRTSAR